MQCTRSLFIGGPWDGNNVILQGNPETFKVPMYEHKAAELGKVEVETSTIVEYFLYRKFNFHTNSSIYELYAPSCWTYDDVMEALIERYTKNVS